MTEGRGRLARSALLLASELAVTFAGVLAASAVESRRDARTHGQRARLDSARARRR